MYVQVVLGEQLVGKLATSWLCLRNATQTVLREKIPHRQLLIETPHRHTIRYIYYTTKCNSAQLIMPEKSEKCHCTDSCNVSAVRIALSHIAPYNAYNAMECNSELLRFDRQIGFWRGWQLLQITDNSQSKTVFCSETYCTVCNQGLQTNAANHNN